MYDLCVIQDLVPTEGAHILKVPKDVFVYWRNQFRFGPLQRRCDQAKKKDTERLLGYDEKLKDKQISRPFQHSQEQSLAGFQESLERYLEMLMAKELIYPSEGFPKINFDLNIACLEQTLQWLDDYRANKFYNKYLMDIEK